MFKKLLLFLFSAVAFALLVSCGEEELGGGIGEFTTVNAAAVVGTTRLESDILTGNTCGTTGSTGGTFTTDLVDVDFTSTRQFSTGTALNLVVSQITVQYTPVNPAIAPALPDYFVAATQTILPDATVTFSVPVVPDNYKFALASRTTQALDLCSADYYEYYVKITFTVSEPGGDGKPRNVITNMNVAIADRT